MARSPRRNPYARYNGTSGVKQYDGEHECMICDAMISRRHYLCTYHYTRTPKDLLPQRGMNKMAIKLICNYWVKEINAGREPREGRKVFFTVRSE